MAAFAEALIQPPDQIDSLRNGVVIPLRSPQQGEGFVNDAGNFALAHGTVEVPGAHEPVKYTVSVPEILGSPVMHMLVPGYGAIKRLSRGLRNRLAGQEHLAAISFEPARDGGYVRDLLDPQKVHIDTLSAILQDLPNNEELRDAPNADKLDLNQVVLEPHSMGGRPATERALKHPNETQQVIYMGSIGLEDPAMFGLVPRFFDSFSRDTTGKFMSGKLVPGVGRLDMARRVGNYYLHNPVRTIGELASCFTADIRRPVKLIGELGVKTSALYFDDDKLMPGTAEKVEVAGTLVDIVERMAGGHLAPQEYPDEVAAMLGHISRRLEQIPR